MTGTMTVVDEFGTELQVGPAPGRDTDLVRLTLSMEEGGMAAHFSPDEFRRFAAGLSAMADLA